MNTKRLLVISAVSTLGVLLAGSIVCANSYACCDCGCCEPESEPIMLEFVCDSDEFDYEPIVIDLETNMTGLEVKEALASALNDGGVMPTDIFLLYDDDNYQGQIYDDNRLGDYVSNGDIITYVISPIATGENYEGKGFFECAEYDQFTGEFRYTFRTFRQ